MPLAALVSNLGQKAVRELPLERQRPVFEVSVMALRIPSLGRGKWGSQLGRSKRPRQAWHIRRRNINPLAGALVPVAEVVHLVRLIVHPEPSAEDRLSSGSPGHPRHAQPRSEVSVSRPIQRSALGANPSARNGHHGLFAMHLFQDRVVLVSQSVIEGEVGAHLERVLRVGHKIGAAMAGEVQCPDEEVIIKRVVNEILRASVCECRVSKLRLARIVKAVALDAHPDLNGVPPLNDAQVIVRVNRGPDLLVERILTGTIEAGDARRHIRGSIDSIQQWRRSKKIMMHGGAVHSASKLVNDRRREKVRQLNNIVGSANEGVIAATHGVRHGVDGGIVDDNVAEDGGFVAEGVIQTEHPVILALIVRPWRSPLVDVGIGGVRLSNWPGRQKGGESGISHARPVRGARHKPDHGTVLDLPETFVIGVEESAVLLDGPAYAAAELVQPEGGHKAEAGKRVDIEAPPRVEYVVAQELESRAMRRVRSGFCNDADLGPGRPALIRGILRRSHAKFPYRVQRNGQPHSRLLVLLLDASGIEAIEGVVVVVRASPDESNVPLAAAAEVDSARSEQGEGGPVATVQRDVLHLF